MTSPAPESTPVQAPASWEGAAPLGIYRSLSPRGGAGSLSAQLRFIQPKGVRSLSVLQPRLFASDTLASPAEMGQAFRELPFFDDASSPASSPDAPTARATALQQQTLRLPRLPADPPAIQPQRLGTDSPEAPIPQPSASETFDVETFDVETSENAILKSASDIAFDSLTPPPPSTEATTPESMGASPPSSNAPGIPQADLQPSSPGANTPSLQRSPLPSPLSSGPPATQDPPSHPTLSAAPGTESPSRPGVDAQPPSVARATSSEEGLPEIQAAPDNTGTAATPREPTTIQPAFDARGERSGQIDSPAGQTQAAAAIPETTLLQRRSESQSTTDTPEWETTSSGAGLPSQTSVEISQQADTSTLQAAADLTQRPAERSLPEPLSVGEGRSPAIPAPSLDYPEAPPTRSTAPDAESVSTQSEPPAGQSAVDKTAAAPAPAIIQRNVEPSTTQSTPEPGITGAGTIGDGSAEPGIGQRNPIQRRSSPSSSQQPDLQQTLPDPVAESKPAVEVTEQGAADSLQAATLDSGIEIAEQRSAGHDQVATSRVEPSTETTSSSPPMADSLGPVDEPSAKSESLPLASAEIAQPVDTDGVPTASPVQRQIEDTPTDLPLLDSRRSPDAAATTSALNTENALPQQAAQSPEAATEASFPAVGETVQPAEPDSIQATTLDASQSATELSGSAGPATSTASPQSAEAEAITTPPRIEAPTVSDPVVQRRQVQPEDLQSSGQAAVQTSAQSTKAAPPAETALERPFMSTNQALQRSIALPQVAQNLGVAAPLRSPPTLDLMPPEQAADDPSTGPDPAVPASVIQRQSIGESALDDTPATSEQAASRPSTVDLSDLPTVLEPPDELPALTPTDPPPEANALDSTPETPVQRRAEAAATIDAPPQVVEPNGAIAPEATRLPSADRAEAGSIPAQTTPDTWNSLADLVAQTAPATPASPASPPPVQTKPTAGAQSAQRTVVSEIAPPEPYSNLNALQTSSQHLQRQLDPQAATSGAATSIQRLAPEAAAPPPETVQGGAEQAAESDANSSKQLEELAQIMYQFVRQRLAIERERLGQSGSSRFH